MRVSSTGCAAAEHLVRLVVELEVVEHELAARRCAVRIVAPEHDPDPRDQLLDAERLGDVVVAADGQAVHLLLGGVAGGEKDHRDLDAVADQALHEREAVVVGQPDVEDHQVGPEVHDGVARLLRGAGGLDREALVLERHRDEIGDGALVVDDEDSVRLACADCGHRTIFARKSGKRLRGCWIYPWALRGVSRSSALARRRAAARGSAPRRRP